MRRTAIPRLGLAAVAVLASAACRTHRPAYLAADWRAPATVTLMPVIDARWSKGVEIDLQAQILQPLQKQLTDKGYAVEVVQATPDAQALDACSGPQAEIDLLLAASPAAKDSVLAIVLEDACASFGGYSSILSVHVYGSWIEVGGRRHIWRDRVAVAQGAGGFLAANLLSFEALLADAVAALGQGLPTRDHGEGAKAGG